MFFVPANSHLPGDCVNPAGPYPRVGPTLILKNKEYSYGGHIRIADLNCFHATCCRTHPHRSGCENCALFFNDISTRIAAVEANVNMKDGCCNPHEGCNIYPSCITSTAAHRWSENRVRYSDLFLTFQTAFPHM